MARYDPLAIHSRVRAAGRYWGWRGINPAGCIAILAGMVVAAMTMKSPLYDGPWRRALGGADLSWLLGLPVAAVSYCLLSVLFERRRVAAAMALPARSE